MSHVALHNLTIKRFHEGLVNKEFTALEAAENYYARIREKDAKINAYLSTREEAALREAEAVDLAIANDEEVPMLAGVPLAVKDNILIKGEVTTAASKILEHYTASYDATVIAKLKEQKAVFLGKTNLDEFAMGSSTENSAFKVTKNPHDPARVPGGSSGGSAAAVASDMTVAALGSDTGGSIRQPAAFCGVVGLKPTYGAVSRSGLIAMASSLDQIGTIAKTVEDATLLFDAIRGKDPLDATSTEPENMEAYREAFLRPDFSKIKKLCVGLPKEYLEVEGLDPAVGREIERAIDKIKWESRCRKSRSPIRATRYPATISSSPRKFPQTSRASTASAIHEFRNLMPKSFRSKSFILPSAEKDSGPNRNAASSSALLCSLPVTTTPTTTKRSASAPSSSMISRKLSKKLTSSSLPSPPRFPSKSARK